MSLPSDNFVTFLIIIYHTALVNHDMYGGRTIQSARSKGIPDYTYNEGESL